jgi:hypothetical protein
LNLEDSWQLIFFFPTLCDHSSVSKSCIKFHNLKKLCFFSTMCFLWSIVCNFYEWNNLHFKKMFLNHLYDIWMEIASRKWIVKSDKFLELAPCRKWGITKFARCLDGSSLSLNLSYSLSIWLMKIWLKWTSNNFTQMNVVFRWYNLVMWGVLIGNIMKI